MAFLKFSVADNASWNLNAGISASATTITLKTWEGASFPSSNFIITLVQYTTPSDPTTPVALREKVLIQSRSGDILTVASGWRGYDWDTWTAFDADDYVYLNVTSKVIEDMQDEITRLETDKLDDGALRASMWNWKTFYTNWSWAETELTNGTSGYFLQSNWPTAAPSWWPGTVDINGSTAENGTLDSNDQILFYDNTAGANRKRAAKASETQEGLVELSTESEAKTGTDTQRVMTPATNKAVNQDQLGATTSITTGTNIQATENGFVFLFMQSTGAGSAIVELYTDATATPTTLVGKIQTYNANENWTLCYPIKKDNYYRVVITDPSDIWTANYDFIPMW